MRKIGVMRGVVRLTAILLVPLAVAGGCAGRRPEPAGSTETAPAVERIYVIVVKEYANLRLSDSGRSATLKRLPRGATALLLTKSGKWYQVLEEETNALGWVHEIYVSEVQE